jgi:hypothetical protein
VPAQCPAQAPSRPGSLALVPADLSLERPDVHQVALALDDKGGVSVGIGAQDVDPSPNVVRADRDLAGDRDAGAPKVPGGVRHDPGVGSVPLERRPDQQGRPDDDLKPDPEHVQHPCRLVNSPMPALAALDP